MSLVMLIDTSNVIHKAHYRKENDAVKEFWTIIDRLNRCFQPDHIIFSLDSDFTTWRHDEYPLYKAQRPLKTPEFEAFKKYIITDISKKYTTMQLEGFESDDLIGSYCAKYQDREEILIITQDLDHAQLVNDRVLQLKFCGEFELEHVDRKYVKCRYNIYPEHLADLKAIAGDSSDNIKGLWKVGAKTAAMLINQWGSIEQILEQIELIGVDDRTELEARFLQSEELLLQFKKLTTICTHLEV